MGIVRDDLAHGSAAHVVISLPHCHDQNFCRRMAALANCMQMNDTSHVHPVQRCMGQVLEVEHLHGPMIYIPHINSYHNLTAGIPLHVYD